MKVTADTNVLVRALVGDDARQSARAKAELAQAELVALPSSALCELVWVLSQGYKVGARDIAEAIRRLANASNIVVDRRVVDAGLAFLEAGGDFADGVIGEEGRRLGGEVFLSFDRKALKLMEAQGRPVRRI